ncbi:hypothetical protein BGX26_001557 [Mortierella sp. AD094]|nr:hypothetical protein BGX26_001557 [Mortierella sp. AD094]
MIKPPHDILQQTVVDVELESNGDGSNAIATLDALRVSEEKPRYLSSQYPNLTPSTESGDKRDHKAHGQKPEERPFDNENVDETDSAPEYPEGGYGWIVLIGAVMVTFWSPGIQFAWGIYQTHLIRENSIPGADASQLSWVGSIAAWGFFVAGPVIVPITAKIGERATLSIALGVLNQYFNKRRGLANGIASAGASVGASVMSTVLRVMLSQIDFRWTLRILGIVMFVVMALATVILRPYRPTRASRDGRNQDAAIRAANVDLKSYRLDFTIFKHLRFTIFLFGTILYGMTALSITQSIPGYAVSVGISSENAAHMITASSITSVFFRLATGYLADRIGVFNEVLGALLIKNAT